MGWNPGQELRRSVASMKAPAETPVERIETRGLPPLAAAFGYQTNLEIPKETVAIMVEQAVAGRVQPAAPIAAPLWKAAVTGEARFRAPVG